MARELGPEGVHVAHVVDGQIDNPRTREASDGRDEEAFLDLNAITERSPVGGQVRRT